MPLFKKVEIKETTAARCILRLGKTNNVVAWNEELKSTVGALYGATAANFCATYICTYIFVEADYLPPIDEGGQAIARGLVTKLQEGA